jgi:hypothetical protein
MTSSLNCVEAPFFTACPTIVGRNTSLICLTMRLLRCLRDPLRFRDIIHGLSAQRSLAKAAIASACLACAAAFSVIAQQPSQARVFTFDNATYSYVPTSLTNSCSTNPCNGTISGSFEYNGTTAGQNSWGNISVTFNPVGTNSNLSTTYDAAFTAATTVSGSNVSILRFWRLDGTAPVAQVYLSGTLLSSGGPYSFYSTTSNRFCSNTSSASVGINPTCATTSSISLATIAGQVVPSPASALGLVPLVLVSLRRKSRREPFGSGVR